MKVRGDLSNKLIHLVRGATSLAVKEKFASILASRELRGGTGFIKGGYTCVCFSEAPVGVLSQMLGNEDMRYAPLGVIVGKVWLFERGGRPVIYQTDAEFDVLPEGLRYRHVRYEPHNGIDFTWEREWRIRAEVLPLDPDQTTIVVPERRWVHAFGGGWHYLVLDDLGVKAEQDFWDAYK
jgi:hypothetical protein